MFSLKKIVLESLSVETLLSILETHKSSIPTNLICHITAHLAVHVYDYIHKSTNSIIDEYHKCKYSCATFFWKICDSLQAAVNTKCFIHFLQSVRLYCEEQLELNFDEGLHFYTLMILIPLILPSYPLLPTQVKNPKVYYDFYTDITDLFQKNMEAFNPIAKTIVSDRVVPGELTKNKCYPLLKIDRVESQYGEAIVASILIKNVSRKLYLPKVYAKMTDENLEKINDESFDLKYLGPEGLSHKYTLVRRDFKEKKNNLKKIKKQKDESDEEESSSSKPKKNIKKRKDESDEEEPSSSRTKKNIKKRKDYSDEEESSSSKSFKKPNVKRKKNDLAEEDFSSITKKKTVPKKKIIKRKEESLLYSEDEANDDDEVETEEEDFLKPKKSKKVQPKTIFKKISESDDSD